jgi:hypothetical protein
MRRSVAFIAFGLFRLVGCAPLALNMAPDRPDAPWRPATNPQGEIVAGQQAPPEQPLNDNYVLPSNRNLARKFRRRRPDLNAGALTHYRS